MKTLQEITDWLSDGNNVRILLVEIVGVGVEGTSSTLYLSSKPFASITTDTPSNKIYLPIIQSGISFKENVSLTGSPSVGYGDIELTNNDNEISEWLNYSWTNREINIYVGDPSWARNDFYPIFSGLVDSISARAYNVLNLLIVDQLKKQDVALTDIKLGGSTTNQDKLLPVLFGECFNISPLLVNPPFHTYRVNSGSINDIIEVRDNGAPVSITKDLVDGTFSLKQYPYGTVTCSAQGTKLKAGEIVRDILENYGTAHSKVPTAKIDVNALVSLDIEAPYVIGNYVDSRITKVRLCQEILSSVGASLLCNNYGVYTVVRLDLQNLTPTLFITDDDIYDGQLSIRSEIPVKPAFNLAYCKNWTVLQTLAEALVPESKPMFSTTWKTVEYANAALLAEMKLSEETEQIDTYLVSKSSALAESQRLVNIWSTPRYIVSIECTAKYLLTQLGTHVSITSRMAGFSERTEGIITGIDRDWISGTVKLEVLI